MFEEVCCAIGLVCFCSAARINPYTNSRCLRPRGMLCRNLRDYVSSEDTDTNSQHTVKPLDNVVLSVFVPWLTGVANPLAIGWTDFRAVRLLNAWLRLKAKRRDAMVLGKGRQSRDTATFPELLWHQRSCLWFTLELKKYSCFHVLQNTRDP